MKKIFLMRRRRKGSSTVIVALSMTVILIIAAFVIDLGTCYFEASSLQNGVDAAALAAGSKLPAAVGDNIAIDNIRRTITQYLEKNGITETPDIEPDNPVNGNYTSITVSVTAQVYTTFAKILGIEKISVKRSATSQISPSTEMKGIVPLSVDSDYFHNALASGQTEHVTLKFGATTGIQGSFGAVDLNGTNGGGANDYSCNLLNGYSGVIKVGQVLPVESGNMSGPTFDAFWSRYDSCNHFSGEGGCTVDHFVDDCPRVVPIPIVQYLDSKTVKVCGFAAFILEAGTGNGTQSTVTGSFVNMAVGTGSYDAGGLGGADDFGVYTVHLTS